MLCATQALLGLEQNQERCELSTGSAAFSFPPHTASSKYPYQVYPTLGFLHLCGVFLWEISLFQMAQSAVLKCHLCS
jgi:hypothetical protein